MENSLDLHKNELFSSKMDLLNAKGHFENFHTKIRYALAAIVVLLIFLSVIFYSIFPILSSNMSTLDAINKTDTKTTSNSVLIPNQKDYNQQRFFGKVAIESIGENNIFKLENSNGDLIGYLTSDNIDLSLIQGLNLVVVGKYSKNLISGQKLIIVEEIEFN